MSPRVKRILWVFGGAFGLLVLAALGVLLFVDVNRYKPQLETAASAALGMEVRFGGRLRLGLFPGVHLTVEDGRMLDEQGTEVAAAKRTRLQLAVLPLLRREFRLARLELSQPRLLIARDPEGKSSAGGMASLSELLRVLDGASVRLADGTFVYADRRSGARIEATGVDLDARRLRLADAKSPEPLAGLSLEGKLACREIRSKDVTASALKASVGGKAGVLRVEPLALRIFGGQGTGTVRADFSGPVPRYRVRFALPGFRVEEFLAVLSPERAAEGSMDFTADLSLEGASGSRLVRTAAGEVSLRSAHLTLLGNDLDRVLSRYESSQSFNLVDVGAVFLAGPLGLAVTKGYGYAGLFRGTGGSTDVRALVSDWTLEGGVARAKDVALATPRNRIALQGGLDLVNGRFAEVTVAAVDDHGCATVQQAIRGSFAEPEVEKPRILRSLAGPVIKLYRQTRNLFPAGPCEPFYAGSVAAPAPA